MLQAEKKFFQVPPSSGSSMVEALLHSHWEQWDCPSGTVCDPLDGTEKEPKPAATILANGISCKRDFQGSGAGRGPVSSKSCFGLDNPNK